jgi:hypothetical protein
MKTKILASLLGLAVAMAFVGCTMPALPPPPAMTSTFDAAEYKLATEKGAGKITGQAFLRTQGGEVRTAAGQMVLLYPATKFTREISTFAEYDVTPAGFTAGTGSVFGDKLKPYTRSYQADAEGKFEFSEVPSGDYIVGTNVEWVVGYAKQGGFIFKEAHVGDGEAVRVIVTR